MQALTNSAFLQALGYAIANSLWQMALLWIVFVLVNSLLKLNAANKYKLAVGAQLLGFLWFAFTLQFYYTQCSEALKLSTEFVSYQHFNLIVPEIGKGFNSNLVGLMLKGERLLPYLSTAYLLLLVFLTFKWTRCYNHAQNIRTNGLHKIDIDWKLFVKNISAQLGIKQEVKIYLSELVSTPMTVGFLKPIILVPLASINHLSAEQMEAVLLHELAHIKRFDYLLNLILSVVETALFFNPFTQLISKSIKKERENSCDDWVLQFQYNPSMYAEALLRIAYMQASPSFAMTLVRNNKNDLLSRVKRMIDSKESRFNYKQQLLALLLMTCIFSSFTWFQPINKKQSTAKTLPALKLKKTLVKEPLLANVSNPLFNPVFFLERPLKKEIAKAMEQVRQNMVAAKLDEEAAQKEIASIMPVAAKNLEEIDWAEVDKDVQESMKNVDVKKLVFASNQADSIAFKNAFSYNYNYSFNNDEFKKGWEQMTEGMKKVGIELDKALKAKDALKIKELQKHQAEMKKAFAQLKSIPFMANVPVPQMNFKGQNNFIAIAEEEKNEAEQSKLRSYKVFEVNSKNKLSLDSMKARLILKRQTASASSITVKGKKVESLVEAPVTYLTNTITEVVPYMSYATCYSEATEPKKKTASKVNITTTACATTSVTGNSTKSKRYEIVVTDKSGEEKKIVVVVED